jgi:hypothetical protein
VGPSGSLANATQDMKKKKKIGTLVFIGFPPPVPA